MERLQEVKALLKRWEAAFAQQHGRRPGTGDVEAAPEDVRRLYREYRALKHRGELAPCPPAEGSPATEQDSGCWGAHLNRQPKAPTSSAANQPVPAASAQHFGRKLKANLGAAIKERPPVPRRTLPPRPKPLPRQEHGATSPAPSLPGDADGGEPPALLLPAAVRALAPLVLAEGPRPRPQGNKFQRLRQTVARRLSSLDAAWLRRCQGEPGPEEPPDGGAEPRGAELRGVEGENVAPAGIRTPPQEPEVSEGARGELVGTEGGERLARSGGDTAAGPRGADGGRAPEELPGGAKKVGGKRRRRDSGAGGSEQPARKQPRKKAAPAPPENLLGDIEEEEEKKLGAPCRAAPARAPRRPPGNFVRLNLKNRSHVRGRMLRGSRLRKQVWKEKWQKKVAQGGGGGGGSALGRSSDVCFRCGAAGHWAAECRGAATAAPPPPQEAGRAREEEEEEEEEEEDPLPTLAEVARRTNSVCPELSESGGGPEGAAGEAAARLEAQRAPYEPPEPPAPVEPLYSLGPGGKVRETPAEVLEALQELGFSSFRPGQEAAVMRILSGLSTLVVLPTGLGKSLCYQLPAYLYRKRSPCVAVVVSPLVALMDDQVSGLPRGLRAVCVHSNMSRAQREAAVEQVRRGAVHALLLSPEALVGGGGSGSCCLPPAAELPPVAFACIDEAHCVSQWSHNFRPSYLRLCKVLRDRLGVRCFLGLTATATPATARDVAAHLGVAEEEEEEGIAGRCAAVPPNLCLSVSMDRDRDQALISLLRGERFGHLDSIIVYCTRREETARVAALIRTCLQGVLLAEPPAAPQDDGDAGRKKERASGSRIKWIADAYHAGLSAAERRRVQRGFMSGRLRVVVATVAFGMGLDKADVRGVVHYNMPKNFESYVQEIGRAGRDGEPARCHLFLDPEGEDLHELRRHIYGDTVDFFTVKKLVQKVFSPCKCRELHQKRRDLGGDAEADDAATAEPAEEAEEPEGGAARGGPQPRRACYMHERAVPVQRTVEELDVREEGIETLLCYLELHPRRWLELLPPTYSSCRVRCYGGPQQLRAAARSCPPLAVFLARERLAGRPHARDSSAEFDVVLLSDSMGWEVPLVKRALRQLQWDPQLRPGGRAGAGSSVLVEFAELSFHLRAYGDLSERELDSVCDFLHRRVVARERAALGQLRACFRAFKSVAFQSCGPHPEQVEEERSSRLRALLRDYFEKEAPGEPAPRGCEEEEEEDEEEDLHGAQDEEDQVRADVRRFLAIRQDEKFSGRAVARIFHGIGSPCYPAQVYGRDRRFWRKHLRFDFHHLMRVATEEILALR